MTADRPAGTLFLVRHGRTACNGDLYVGWGNPPLDACGAAQARALLDALPRHERLDAIYSSPLGRAIATAQPIAELHDLALNLRDEMREINYGVFQGARKDDVRVKLRRTYRYDPMPAGESLFDVYRRVRRFSHDVSAALAGGHRVLIVGHFWSNRMLLGCLQQTDFDSIMDQPPYKPANGSLLEVVCDLSAGGSVSVQRADLRTGGVVRS